MMFSFTIRSETQATIDYIESDKRNLFHTFIECKEDKQMFYQLVLRRKQIKETKNTDKMVWRKKRWIRENVYGGDTKKTDKVCAELATTDCVMKDRFHNDDRDEDYYLWDEDRVQTDRVQTQIESTDR